MDTSLLIYMIVLSATSGIQKFKEEPVKSEVNPGENTTLACIITERVGDCRWVKDGTPVGMFPGKYVWSGNQSLDDCSITILHADREFDHGLWQCTVTATSLVSKDALVSKEAHLLVRKPPTEVVIRQGHTVLQDRYQVVEGVNTTLSCSGEGGDPPPSLRWILPPSIGQFFVYEDDLSSLLTMSVHRQETGESVLCEASHPTLSKPIVRSLLLDVQYLPTVHVVYERNGTTTSLKGSHSSLIVQEGESLVLSCRGEGNPAPKTAWRKEGQLDRFNKGESIIFQRIEREDRGIYSCLAQNQVGMTGPHLLRLDVEYAPSLVSTVPVSLVRTRVGTTQMFQCSGDGNPTPIYQWSQVLNKQRKIRGNMRTLTLNNISWPDSGDYICTASNTLGGVERHGESVPISLQVYGAPELYVETEKVEAGKGADVKLRISFCAHPRPEVKWILGNLVLSPGSRHGRLIADVLTNIKGYSVCYSSTVFILESQPGDSDTYSVHVENVHGSSSAVLHLFVHETDYLLGVVAGIVGGVLVLLLLSILFIHLHPCQSHQHPPPGVNNGELFCTQKTELDGALGSGIFLSASQTQDCNLHMLNQQTFHTFKKGRKVYEEDIVHGKYSVVSSNLNNVNKDFSNLAGATDDYPLIVNNIRTSDTSTTFSRGNTLDNRFATTSSRGNAQDNSSRLNPANQQRDKFLSLKHDKNRKVIMDTIGERYDSLKNSRDRRYREQRGNELDRLP